MKKQRPSSEIVDVTPRIRVLAIDDDASAIAVLEAYCLAANFELQYTHEPTEALELARAQQPDVIISDVMMPGMNGYEATRVLREKAVTTPIIALTANAMIDDEKKCLDAGCDDYLAKPIKHQKLSQLISKYISSKESVSAGISNLAKS